MTKVGGRRWYLAVALTLLGLGCSALLAWDYLVGGGAACREGGGCDLVRASSYSAVAGVPVPVLGLAYFGGLSTLLVLGLDRWFRLIAWSGALVGAGLLVIQWQVVGAFCPWCVVVDLSAIALPFTVARLGPSVRLVRRVALVGPAVAMVAAVVLASAERPRAATRSVAPERPAALYTITEFADFECPYCRRLHGMLSEVLQDYPAIRIERKHVPLARHAHAELAARVACCADEAGQGEAMADRLFRSKDLALPRCLEFADELGIDRKVLGECLGSSRVSERLRKDRREASRLGIGSLPALLIGGQLFEGVPTEQQLRNSLDSLVASR
ncbi:MAG: thioredoxin domain-containing protein [Deltaproteobacteria bacterium]|jgi:protein-disulfide isomerase/uncharacterized membrane protein|nr:thioredoxin domain-containing protein [Deltaproteobacteria bacterium]